MGRIGRSYPRFPHQAPREKVAPRNAEGRTPLASALVGVVAALGLIGWLLTR